MTRIAAGVLLAVTTLWAPPSSARFNPVAEAGIERIADAHLPAEARLADQNGQPVRLGDYFGGPPLVFAAVQYHCPNLCGITLDGLFAGLAASGLVEGRDYRVVAVSIDRREGPAEAAESLAALGRRWPVNGNAVHFLSGPAAVEVGRAMGVRSGWDAEHQQFAHISAAALTTPDGRLVRWMAGVQFDPRALRLGLVEAGQGRLGGWRDQVQLLCYGYDPVTGRYGGAIQRMLEVTGAATVGALGLFVWLALRRERRER